MEHLPGYDKWLNPPAEKEAFCACGHREALHSFSSEFPSCSACAELGHPEQCAEFIELDDWVVNELGSYIED